MDNALTVTNFILTVRARHSAVSPSKNRTAGRPEETPRKGRGEMGGTVGRRGIATVLRVKVSGDTSGHVAVSAPLGPPVPRANDLPEAQCLASGQSPTNRAQKEEVSR
jgi:hypothetical protein